MRDTTELVLTMPELAQTLYPHLTAEEKAALPLTQDVNLRAHLEIDRGLVRGGMSVKEFTRLRPTGTELPVDLESRVQQDVPIRPEIVFDVLMYALSKYPEIGEQLVAILGYMPTVVPPAQVQEEIES